MKFKLNHGEKSLDLYVNSKITCKFEDASFTWIREVYM